MSRQPRFWEVILTLVIGLLVVIAVWSAAPWAADDPEDALDCEEVSVFCGTPPGGQELPEMQSSPIIEGTPGVEGTLPVTPDAPDEGEVPGV